MAIGLPWLIATLIIGMSPAAIADHRVAVLNKPLISLKEAVQALETNASETLVIGVVSDYYNDLVLQRYCHAKLAPGFALIKTEQLEIDSIWKLKSDHELQQILAKNGLTPDSKKRILLFDDIRFACGNNTTRFDASARLLAILHYFGFTDVSIILDEAVSPSFPDQCHQSQTQPAETFSTKPWLPERADIFVNYDTLTEVLAGEFGPYHLLDARSAEEFAGIATGYDYVQLAGKIPTAENIINGEYQVSHSEDLASILGRLQATLTEKDIARDDRIIWYCGTAWRASRMFALTLALGYTRVAIYDGGWNEWQQHHPEDAMIRNEYPTLSSSQPARLG